MILKTTVSQFFGKEELACQEGSKSLLGKFEMKYLI
jgi:hypothetical protein